MPCAIITVIIIRATAIVSMNVPLPCRQRNVDMAFATWTSNIILYFSLLRLSSECYTSDLL